MNRYRILTDKERAITNKLNQLTQHSKFVAHHKDTMYMYGTCRRFKNNYRNSSTDKGIAHRYIHLMIMRIAWSAVGRSRKNNIEKITDNEKKMTVEKINLLNGCAHYTVGSCTACTNIIRNAEKHWHHRLSRGLNQH